MITTTNFGRTVVVKTSSDAALQYLKKNVETPEQLPQVIFLDLNMPVVDGFGFFNRIWKVYLMQWRNFQVIVLSSSISPDDINRASTNPYVAKYINTTVERKVSRRDKFLKAFSI